MYVKNVSLKNYRNYESANVTLSSGLNVLVGQNAQGKTNFLESIYIGATGHSNRTNTDRELIQFQSEEAHVRLMVHNGSYEDRIDVHLKRDDKKGMAVNGIPIKKLSQLFGTLLVVMFSPEDLQLIKSGPAERRRFVDLELCQLNPVYYYELQQYFRVLKQRNNLLKSLYKNRELLPTLAVWDEKLIEHGGRIETLRQSFIERLNVWAGEIHRSVTNGREELGLFYKANVSQTEWADKLRKSLERDIAQGSTSVGIHKDDVGFFINGSDARIYGSQGQQRTAALSAKMAEIYMIREEKREDPVLLLDDVLSELDEGRQRFLMRRVNSLQTIITCTGVEDVLRNIGEKARMYIVEQGRVNEKTV